MTIREKIGIKHFRKVASENQYYIWHFLQREQNTSELGLISYFDEPNDDTKINFTKYILDKIDIPYFESYTDESVDFLMDSGIEPTFIYKIPKTENMASPKKRYYTPVFLGFNKFKLIGGSHQVCYCPEYFIELVAKLNPDYILNSTFD